MAVTVGRFQLLSLRRATKNVGGVVDEDKDLATECPCDAEKANAVAWSDLIFMVNDGGDGDVEEEKCGDKLSNEGSVEGLELNLDQVDEGGWWRVYVVFPLLAHFLRHFFSLVGTIDGMRVDEVGEKGWCFFMRKEKK